MGFGKLNEETMKLLRFILSFIPPTIALLGVELLPYKSVPLDLWGSIGFFMLLGGMFSWGWIFPIVLKEV
jgi:hypothetical protein